jgi:formylglycine-generating enzyme required for sulfatase activity
VWFSVWETRIQDYEMFVKEGHWARLWPEKPDFTQTPSHPVVNVSWEDAKDFCIWMTLKDRSMGLLLTNQVYRLPTDLEWSKAVGLPQETRTTAEKRSSQFSGYYPWGAAVVRKDSEKPKVGQNLRLNAPPDAANYIGNEDGYKFKAPVGSFKPNKLGIFDLGGNALEWVIDFADDGRRHVLRGSSWANSGLPSSARDYTLPNNMIGDVGFRCVFVDTPSSP